MSKKEKITLRFKRKIAKMIRKEELPENIVFDADKSEVILPSGQKFRIPQRFII